MCRVVRANLPLSRQTFFLSFPLPFSDHQNPSHPPPRFTLEAFSFKTDRKPTAPQRAVLGEAAVKVEEQLVTTAARECAHSEEFLR
jgi:hypothetical protein